MTLAQLGRQVAGLGAVVSLVRGSVAQRVAHLSPLPMLLVK